MSLISLLVNDLLPTALFGIACCVVFAAVGYGGIDGDMTISLGMDGERERQVGQVNLCL